MALNLHERLLVYKLDQNKVINTIIRGRTYRVIVSVGEALNEHLKLKIKRCSYGASLIIDNYAVSDEYHDYVTLDGVDSGETSSPRGQSSVAFAFTGFSHSDATSGE